MKMKKSYQMMLLSKFALVFSFLYSLQSHAGTVVFSFDSNNMTVIENNLVYVFPTAVFRKLFGERSYGESISIPNQYKGFLVTTDPPPPSSTTVADEKSVIKSIPYGDMVYYQMNQYYLLDKKRLNTSSKSKEKLFSRDIEYTWIIPEHRLATRNISAVERSAKNLVYFRITDTNSFAIKGELLSSETKGVLAIKVLNKIYYVEGKNVEIVKPNRPEEPLKINKNRLLWVANE